MKSLDEMEEMNRFQRFRAHQGDERRRQDHFVTLIWKVFMIWKNCREFKGYEPMNFRGEEWSKIEDTILELTAKIQELQNEVNCMNDSRDFKDAESVRSGQSHVTSQPAFSPLFRDPGGMLSRSMGMPSRNDGPPDIWDTLGTRMVHMGNVFVTPTTASSSAPFPQGFNPWISCVSEHTSPHVMSESQTPNTALDPRCQSGPSARYSFDPSEGRFPNNFGTDQQRLQISDLHFDKFPDPATFACWKIRFKTEVCMYLLTISLRKLCCGSKKWRWLNRMI